MLTQRETGATSIRLLRKVSHTDKEASTAGVELSLLPENLVTEINELEPAILQPWEDGCWRYLQLLSTAKLLDNVPDLLV